MPNFGKIELDADERLPEETFLKHLSAYEELYTEHCEVILIPEYTKKGNHNNNIFNPINIKNILNNSLNSSPTQ